MKRIKIKSLFLLGVVGVLSLGCENNLQDDASLEVSEDPLVEVAELSSQLSSGMDLTLASRGSSNETARYGGGGRPDGAGGGRPDGASYGGRPNGAGGFGGMNFLAYNDDPNLQVISIAERLGERLNFWMFASLGVDVKHYDQDGVLVELDMTERPAHGFWNNEDAPKIVQTVIDFGEGISIDRRNNTISLSGIITIDRSFDDNQLTEEVSLQNFSLNDALIEGTKTSTRSFNAETGEGQMSSIVSGGQFTFSDGTSASWESTSSRFISIEINEDGGRPTSGTSSSEGETSVTSSDGSVLYSHKTISPIMTDVSCGGGRQGRRPISGDIETVYGEDIIKVDFGDGDCSSSITVTINGEEVVVGG